MPTPEIQNQIFQFLYGQSSLLGRYEVPEHLGRDRLREEINFMVRDLSLIVPRNITPDRLAEVLERMHSELRRVYMGRKWPQVGMLINCLSEALREAERATGGVLSPGSGEVDQATVESARSFLKKHGKACPWLNNPAITRALIQIGAVKSLGEARHLGLDMTLQEAEIARAEPITAAQLKHHCEILAKLTGKPLDEVMKSEQEIREKRKADSAKGKTEAG